MEEEVGMLICKLQRFTSDKGHFIKIKLTINHEAFSIIVHVPNSKLPNT